MYAVVRWDRVVDPVRRREVVQRVTDGLIPALRQIPGFVACQIVAADDDGVVCIAAFADRGGAETAAHKAADWVTEHLAPLLGEPAGIASGPLWRT